MTKQAADGGSGPASLRRRLITDTDIAAITDLLAAGFPRRSRRSWQLGLARLARREVPPGLPRYGVMLLAHERAVGVLLTICAEVGAAGQRVRRCNLSSWHTEPAFAPYAPLLLGAALRLPDTTFVNISPAPHTEAIIEAQGFRAFCRGSLLSVPVLARRTAARRATDLRIGADLPEQELVDAHIALGCPCLAVREGDDLLPFVFSAPRRLRGVLPASQLLFCRDLDGYARCAGALGRALLRRGILGVLVDTAEPIPNLPGRRINATQGRYWRGPNPPRPGDLAFTELALFED